MRVLCRHGHFALYPDAAGEASEFSRIFEAPLVREGDFYTFAQLGKLPRYSLAGKKFGNVTASATYEGRGAWDVFRKNGWVFSLTSRLIVPKASVSISVSPVNAGEWIASETPLMQPGSRLPSGQIILSYDGFLDLGYLRLRLQEFSYE